MVSATKDPGGGEDGRPTPFCSKYQHTNTKKSTYKYKNINIQKQKNQHTKESNTYFTKLQKRTIYMQFDMVHSLFA